MLVIIDLHVIVYSYLGDIPVISYRYVIVYEYLKTVSSRAFQW